MTRASACREWLRENPGWHFSSDVAEGLAAKDLACRQRIARALFQASDGKRQPIERKGSRHSYRYRWPE